MKLWEAQVDIQQKYCTINLLYIKFFVNGADMKATPGGNLPVDEIFGRDAFIEQLWAALDRNSVRIEAERRIGKTCVLRKMNAQPKAGWIAIFLDLEKVHSAAEFAELVCTEVRSRLSLWRRQSHRVMKFIKALGGTEAGGFKFPEKKDHPDGYWKNLLTLTIEDLVEEQAKAGKRVVFCFDEMPWMLSASGDPDRDGPTTAMEVLDVLRALRQSPTTGAGFRMILCGSIGLHHVLRELAGKGHRNHIHWVVNEVKTGDRAGTVAEAEAIILRMLTAEHDPCNLRHFLTRIGDYYPLDQKTALALLDHAAEATAPLGVAELLNVAKAAGATDDERVRELLRQLAVDHYLKRDTTGRYTFRHDLLRRWWLLERGLSEQAGA